MLIRVDNSAFTIVQSMSQLTAVLENMEEDKRLLLTTPEHSIYYMGFNYIQQMVEELSEPHSNIYDIFVLNISDHYALYAYILKSKFKKVLVSNDDMVTVKKLQEVLSLCDVYVYNR